MEADMHAPDLRPGLRVIGAAIGAVLASLVFVSCYALAGVAAFELVLPLRSLLGPDGLVGFAPGLLVAVWGVPPIAAGVAGGSFALRAGRDERWSGAWMGALTFVVAIPLAIMVFAFAAASDQPAPSILEIPIGILGMAMLSILAGIVLAPLPVVCVVSGLAWGAIVRFFARTRGMDWPSNAQPLAVAPLVAIVALAMAGWLLAGLPMFSLGGVD